MKARYLLTACLIPAAIAYGAEAKSETSTGSAAAAFSRLKTLAGEWEADTPMGKSTVTYEVIAGGTAVVERESGPKMPVMMTVYHVDGNRLLLTHYCMAGNQPRMSAKRYDAGSGDLEFQFLDATNLTSGAGHMHNVQFRFLDDRHFSADWQFYENGKPKMGEAFQYTRVR